MPVRNAEYSGSKHASSAAAAHAEPREAPRRRSQPKRAASVASWKIGKSSAIA